MNYPIKLKGINIGYSCGVKIVFMTAVPPVRFVNLLPLEGED
jgi:hypothetical protein